MALKVKYKILYLEAETTQTHLVKTELGKSRFNFEVRVVDNETDYRKALTGFSPDIVLSDNSNKRFDFNEARRLLSENHIKIPFIAISASMTEEFAVSIVKNGVTDYIIHDRLKRLPFAIINAIEKYHSEDDCMQLLNEVRNKEILANETIKQNEIKLGQVLNNLEKIMDSSLDIICTINEEGKFVTVSAASNNILGYTPQELVGKKYIDFVFKKDVDRSLKTAIETRNGIPVSLFENRYIHKNGRIVPLLWSAKWDDADKTTYCIAKDATQKKQLEKEFENERQRFKDVFFQAPTIMAIVKGPNYIFESANTLYLQLIGKRDIIGKSVKEVMPEISKQGFIELLDNVYNTGETFRANEMLIKLDQNGTGELIDKYLNFIYQASWNSDDNIEGIFVFAVDVTEQVLSRKKIEESENRFRVIIEKSAEIITLSSKEGKMLYISPSAVKTFGYALSDLSNLLSFNFIHPDDIKSFISNREIILKTEGQSYSCQLRLLHKNGNWIWCEVAVTNMLQEAGVNAVVSNFRDISEKKIAEQQQEFDRNNLDALINNTSNLMWSVDKNLNLITSNKPFDKMAILNFGKTIPKGAKVLASSYSPEMMNHFKQLYERAFAGESFTEVEYFDYPVEQWSEISYYPIRKGDEIIGTACNARDITESKKYEENLRRSETRFREIFNSVPEALVIFDPNTGKFVNFNDNVIASLKYNPEEFLKMGPADISPPFQKDGRSSEEKSKEFLLNALEGEKQMFEWLFVDANGKELLCEVRLSILFNANSPELLGSIIDITERKDIEQKMIELNNRLVLASKAAGMGIWEWDHKNDHINWDERMYDIYNVDPFTFGSSFAEFLSLLHPEDKDRVDKETQMAITGEKEYNLEFRIIPKDQSIIYIKAVGITEKDNDGNIVKLIGVNWDITKRKLEEIKIIESELKYRSLIEQASDAIVVVNTQDFVLEVNTSAEILFGYSKDELLKMNMQDLVFEKDSPPRTSEVANGETVVYERRMKRKNKSAVDVEISARMIPGGRILAMFRDITQRKKAELLIHESEARLAEAQAFSHVSNWEIDLVTGINKWSNEFYAIFGIEREEIQPSPEAFLKLVHPDDYKMAEEKISNALKKSESSFFTARVNTKDGSERNFYTEWKFEFDENRKPIRLYGILQDVTERIIAENSLKQNEIRLNKLNEYLQKQTNELALSNAELEQFAYVASHDLQEPLRMITGFLTQLEKKYGDIIDDKGKKYIGFAVDGARRMRPIILDLLEFSRVGRIEEDIEELDMNDLLHEIKILLRKKIEEKNAVLIIDKLPKIHTHRSPMRQIFQNLIDNALKYSNKDIPVQIHITVKELKDDWQFAVIDNGIGIEKEYFDKIFIIFQRLHAKDKYSGTGMGLAITKKIIEAKGGKIWVESEEGKGSAFYFTIKK